MPLPTTRVVTGHYVNPATGANQSGRVVISPYPGVWTDETGDQVLTGGATVELVAGAFSVTLVTTDAAGVEPATGRMWVLEERIDGRPYRRRAFALDAGVDSIDVTDLVDADPGDVGYVRGPEGPAGPSGTAGADGENWSWLPRPSEHGLITWTGDPNDAGHVTAQSAGGVAGRITLVKIPIREQVTISNIWLGLSGIDAGASLSNCYLGIYDAAGTLKGVTADISASLMTSAIAKGLPLLTPFVAAPGAYFIAMLLGAGSTWTTNSLHFKATGAGISVNANLAAPNLRYSTILTGQTSLPASLTLSSQATSTINTGWGSQWYGVS